MSRSGSRFCRHISAGTKGKLAAQGFAQALTFVRFVLAVPGVQTCLSPRVQGLANRMAGEHKPSNQARDLTVFEVTDTSLHLLDTFAAGVFLFQIYARNRWSDIRFVKTSEFDVLQIRRETRGHIEGRAEDVKQSNRKKKQTLFMPLVAPVQGVHQSIVWGWPSFNGERPGKAGHLAPPPIWATAETLKRPAIKPLAASSDKQETCMPRMSAMCLM